MNFVAIDFETATSARSSACALGVAVVSGGWVVENRSWLIRPEPLEFKPWNIRIHHIRPQDVKDRPTIAELWPEIQLYLENNIIVAHNAAFDISVLKHSLLTFDITPPPYSYCCSVKVAQKVWPELPRHRLNVMADYLGIDFLHHDARDDAYASACIILRAAEKLKVSSVEELCTITGCKMGQLKCEE